MRCVAVLTVRNEGAFLLEWIAHHQCVGFTDFLVFSNDCEDGTDLILDRLQEMGVLTHLPNPAPWGKNGLHFKALNRAARHPLVKKSDWILSFDVDEFVNIHVGDHTLRALTDALPEADAIALSWRVFGNDGVIAYQDRPVCEQFVNAAPTQLYWPSALPLFKTLYRNNGIYGKPGVHRPRAPDPQRVGAARWYSGAGEALGSGFQTNRIASEFGRDNYTLAQLNHYVLGAMESFVLKSWRGRSVHSSEVQALDYWVERNHCAQEDRTIHALTPARTEAMAALREDAQLDALHRKAVAWRRAKFEALMMEEPYRALMARLLVSQPSRAMPPEQAHRLMYYHMKAHQRQKS